MAAAGGDDDRVEGDNAADEEVGGDRFVTPAELREVFVRCDVGVKPAVVSRVIRRLGLGSVLVFVKSNESAHRLAILLQQLGHKTAELSSQVGRINKKCAKND